MNKLTALSKLANAYHYLAENPGTSVHTIVVIYDAFHRIRRSLRIGDLIPQPKCSEGYNPKGPAHF